MSAIVTAAPEDLGLCSKRLGRIRPWMQGYVDEGKLPGALTLVARRGEVVCLEVLGQRDVGAGEPLRSDTLFRIYSMTKPVTSVAVMMLYEAGCFQLDDPLARFIPEFSDMRVYVGGEADEIRTEGAHTPITIHQLLTHTSGLVYGFRNASPVSALYREQRTDFRNDGDGLAEVVGRLSCLPLAHQPGTRWSYGVSTDVLGRLIEVVSGESLDRFFSERVLGPLAMTETGFSLPAEKAQRFAALYQATDEGGMKLVEGAASSPYIDAVSAFSGGSGLVSTVSDYFRFTEMLRCGGQLDGTRLLSRKTVELMTRNHLPGDLSDMGQASFNETTMEGIGFGLGFAVTLDPAKAKVIGTPGEYSWGGLAGTAFWIDPGEDLTVIFMTQLSPSDRYPLRRELRVLTYQALID